MDLAGDERAQAIQIGAVLLFGILIIGVSIHQAVIVPNQNRQVEFDHFTGAQDDMEGLRNAVLRAGQTASAVPAGVSLGTTYPARLIAQQPQSSSGVLRTAKIGGAGTEIELQNTDANISNICGLDTLTTRSAGYHPGYNYLDEVGNITYENTLVYTNGRSGGRAVQTDQQLIAGRTIHVYPLLGNHSQGGRTVSSITFRGGVTGENSSVPGPFSLILPTRLSAAEWQEQLGEQPQVSGVESAGPQAVNITFASDGAYDIRCSPVGAGTQPENTPTVDDGSDGGSANGGNQGVNPNSSGEVVLRDIYESNSTSTLSANQVSLQLENRDTDTYQNITDLRFPFFSPAGQGNAGAVLPESFDYQSTVIPRLGPYEPIDRRDIPPGGRANVTLSFYCGDSGAGSDPYDLAQGDFFIVDALFEDGTYRTYFVVLTDSGQSGNRCGGNTGGGGPPGNQGGGP